MEKELQSFAAVIGRSPGRTRLCSSRLDYGSFHTRNGLAGYSGGSRIPIGYYANARAAGLVAHVFCSSFVHVFPKVA